MKQLVAEYKVKDIVYASSLTMDNTRKLKAANYIRARPRGQSYSFSEAIYCNLIYHLAKDYNIRPFSNVTNYAHAFEYYGDKLLTAKYAMASPTRSSITPLILVDILEESIAEKLANQIKVNKFKTGFLPKSNLRNTKESIFFNLNLIREDCSRKLDYAIANL